MADSDTRVPARLAVDWRDPSYLDSAALEAEQRRVFEVCSACRRCEMLCDSFPRLFELADSQPDAIGTAPATSLASVVDACTLCDMCYPVCPYIPPHVYAVDFPSLMVRSRAHEAREGKAGRVARELRKTDRNGRLMTSVAPIVNWASQPGNPLTRPALEWMTGIHRDSELPRAHRTSFSRKARAAPRAPAADAPAAGRKAVIYATCFVEYHNPSIGLAARDVLAKNGIETEIVYPECCGMPQLEEGDMGEVTRRARRVAAELGGFLDDGYDVVTLVPSCALMLKTTWPQYLAGDKAVERLAANAFDVCEYVVALARTDGLAEGLAPLDGGVALHLACHARAQGVGAKAAVMLRMIPECNVMITEGCSGHGGTWGVLKENFDTSMKVGERVMRHTAESGRRYLASECPLAGDRIAHGMRSAPGKAPAASESSLHPIELMAMSYGFAR